MKNFMKITVMFLAIVFMSCSCEKEPIVLDELITATELTGVWESVYFEYGGELYLDCVELGDAHNPDVRENHVLLINMDIDVDGESTITDICNDNVVRDNVKTALDGNMLNFTTSDGQVLEISFKILSYENDEIVLTVIDENIINFNMLDDARYTLVKQ